MRQLQTISEAALAHLQFDDLVAQLLVRVTAILDADTAAVLLLDEERDELVAVAGKGIEEEVEAEVRVPLGRGFAGRVAQERRPIIVPDVPSSDIFNPLLIEKGLRSLLGVPLFVEGRVTGVLHVGSLARREFTEDDAELLQLAGDRIALAIDHSRLYEAERSARLRAEEAIDRIRRIEAISEVALHHIAVEDAVLEQMLSRVRDVLETDTAALLVSDDSTQLLVGLVAKGLEAEIERVEVPIGRGFAGTIAERREPLALDEVGEFPVISPLLREKGIRSLLGVPLVVEDRLLGVLHVGSIAPRHFTDEDRALLALAGDRIAVALDHARLFEHEHAVATTLQRTLLPDRLPEIPGAEIATRYIPGAGAAVGGDWYDVVPLRDGRLAIAMGDVVSRGVRAASVMGQLRNALRAYALERYEPAMVLDRLNGVTRSIEGREMATLLFGVFDPETSVLLYASAGHPPPVVLSADGDVSLLEDGTGPPLGALPDSSFVEARFEIEPGSTLLLYTDGIVERRDMWIDEGLERLTQAVADLGGEGPEALLDRLVGALLPPASDEQDDVALLALRTEPHFVGPLRLRFPADPTVLVGLRQALRQWLGALGAEEDETYDVLVAATEAAANAVEHAYGPGDATFDVEAHPGEHGEVSVIVRDSGSWRPPRGHNRGRGTLLMQELMDDFKVTTGETGTEVRMSKRLAGALVA